MYSICLALRLYKCRQCILIPNYQSDILPYQYAALSVLTLALTVLERRVELRQLKTNSLNRDLHYHLIDNPGQSG